MKVVCEVAKACSNKACPHHESHEPVRNDPWNCAWPADCDSFEMVDIRIRRRLVETRCVSVPPVKGAG